MRLGNLNETGWDLLAFLGGLAMAWYLGWSTTDLVWSLWLSSLILGSLTLLITIASGQYVVWKISGLSAFPAQLRPFSRLASIVGSLFMLVFFTFHFSGFHAGHASFLASFFPLQGLPEGVFSEAFMNPILLWKTAISHVFPLYGLFLLPVLLSERKQLLGFWLKAQSLANLAHSEMRSDVIALMHHNRKQAMQKLLYQPYASVIRMHVLIILLGMMSFLQLEGFWLYALAYLVFFFPWSRFRKPATA